MAKFWCTNCQQEVEHRAYYCHSKCGNDCDQVCSKCNQKTLTTTLSSPCDSVEGAVRQATGEAQRRARDNGVTGDITVETLRFDSNNGRYQTMVLVYNTINKKASISKPAGW